MLVFTKNQKPALVEPPTKMRRKKKIKMDAGSGLSKMKKVTLLLAVSVMRVNLIDAAALFFMVKVLKLTMMATTNTRLKVPWKTLSAMRHLQKTVFFFSDWSWAQGLTLMEEEQERGAAWVAGLNSNNTTVPITNDPGSVRSTSFRRATPCQPQRVPKEINRALPLNIIKQLHIGVPHDAVLNRIEREGIRKEEGQAWTLDDLFLEMDLEELKENETTCPGRHGLSEFPTPSPMWYCSRCYSKTGKQTGHPQGTIFYGCRTCDFDLCRVCYKELESAKARQEKTNDGQMAAVWSLDDVEEGDDGDEESGEDDDLLLEDAPFELLGVLIQKAIETTQWEVRSALVESGL